MSTQLRIRFLLAASVGILAFSAVLHSGSSSDPSMPGMDMSAPASSPHERATPQGQPPAPEDAAKAAKTPDGYSAVRVPGEVQQRIGVTLGRVERTPLTMMIRTVGIVAPDEARIAHIHLKTEGWVEKLYANYTGQKVRSGDPLLAIYSPAYFTAQREFLTALRTPSAGLQSDADQALVADVARRRLELWDIPSDEIAALEKSGTPRKALVLRSPISGTVLEKQAFAGQYVTPQNDLYVVADLSTVWMQARVFQSELPHVALGMSVSVSFPALGSPLSGKVVFIDPVLDQTSRSAQVRIELQNTAGQLRPGMFGNVTISHAMGSGLTVPASAVIRTGTRAIAYRAEAFGRFVPVEVRISPLAYGDRLEVIAGLKDGERVVTSANFLIDSESRLEAGANSMAGMPGMDSGATSGDAGMANMPGVGDTRPQRK